MTSPTKPNSSDPEDRAPVTGVGNTSSGSATVQAFGNVTVNSTSNSAMFILETGRRLDGQVTPADAARKWEPAAIAEMLDLLRPTLAPEPEDGDD